MKRKILYFFLGMIIIFGMASAVSAAPDVTSLAEKVAGKAGYDTAGVTDTSISRTIGGIIRYVLGMVGVIFLVLTVYAGFLWMTAGGNEDNVAKAKKILSSSFIGLVVVAAAYGITALVLSIVLKTASPEGTFTGGNENFVDRKMGCCYEESTNRCFNFASAEQCTGRWFSDIACNNMGQAEGINCDVQN